MQLALRQVDQVLVIAFVGRVNLEGDESIAFKERLKGLIADGHIHVVLDLGNVGFVDSGGLAPKYKRRFSAGSELSGVSPAVQVAPVSARVECSAATSSPFSSVILATSPSHSWVASGQTFDLESLI